MDATHLAAQVPSARLIQQLAAAGDLASIRLLRQKNCPWDVTAICEAARKRHVDLVYWLIENGAPLDFIDALPAALEGGHQQLVAHFVSLAGPLKVEFIWMAAAQGYLRALKALRQLGCPWDPAAYFQAALHGELNSLKWLLAEGCPFDADETFAFAAQGGHGDIIAYLQAQGHKLGKGACVMAAINGFIPALTYLRARKIPWDYLCCSLAASKGHLDTLKWCMDHGAPVESLHIFMDAAEGGHGHIIRFMIEKGHVGACRAAMLFSASRGKIAALNTLYTHGSVADGMEVFLGADLCQEAVVAGQVDSLKWMVAKKVGFDPHTALAFAAEHGHKRVLDYLLAHGGAVLAADACTAAARENLVKGLTALRARGCPWDERTPTAAASRGNAQVLRVLLDGGCPVNFDQAVAEAARGGHKGVIDLLLMKTGRGLSTSTCDAALKLCSLSGVKLLHTKGCPLGPAAGEIAAGTGSLALLKWVLLEERHPLVNPDAAFVAAAVSGGPKDIIDFLLSRGYKLTADTAATAAARPSVGALQLLVKQRNCPLTPAVPIAAIKAGRQSNLEWLLINRCPLDNEQCAAAAAEKGDAGIMQLVEWGTMSPAVLQGSGQDCKRKWAEAGMLRVHFARLRQATLDNVLNTVVTSAKLLAAFLHGCDASAGLFLQNRDASFATLLQLVVPHPQQGPLMQERTARCWLQSVTVLCTVFAEASLPVSLQDGCRRVISPLLRLIGLARDQLGYTCSAEVADAAALTREVRKTAKTALVTALWALRNCVAESSASQNALIACSSGLQKVALVGEQWEDEEGLWMDACRPACDALACVLRARPISEGLKGADAEPLALSLLGSLGAVVFNPAGSCGAGAPSIVASILTSLSMLAISRAGHLAVMSFVDRDVTVAVSRAAAPAPHLPERYLLGAVKQAMLSFGGSPLVAAAGGALLANILRAPTPSIGTADLKQRFVDIGGVELMAQVLSMHAGKRAVVVEATHALAIVTFRLGGSFAALDALMAMPNGREIIRQVTSALEAVALKQQPD